MKQILIGVLMLGAISGCKAGVSDNYKVPTPSSPAPAPSIDLPASTAAIEPTSLDKKDQYYRNCAEARAAGAAPLRQGLDDGYRIALDRDKDGVACD